MNGRIPQIAALLALILVLCAPALADGPAPILKDEVQLFDAAEQSRLTEQMQPLCEFGTPMLWVTRKSGEAESLCRTEYRASIGDGESGVLFMINLSSRMLYLYVDGAIGKVISVSDSLDITDNVYRKASGGYYDSCAAEVFSQVGRLLRSEHIARPMRIITSALLSLCSALLFTFVMVTRPGHKGIFKYRKTPEAVQHPSAVQFIAPGTGAVTVVSSRLIRTVRLNTGGSGSGGYRSGSHGSFGGGRSGGGGFGGGHGGGHRF